MRVISNASGRTTLADPAGFTGLVWRTEMLVEDRLAGLRMTYAPGARSHWHVHTADQALVVLEGRGLVEWEGGPGARKNLERATGCT